MTVTINGANDIVYTVNDDGRSVRDQAAVPAPAHRRLRHSRQGFGLATQTDVGVELGLQVIYRQGPTVLQQRRLRR